MRQRAAAVDVLVGINSIAAHQLDVQVAVAQNCYTVLAQHVYNSLLVGINSIPADQLDVQVAIIQQNCYTILPQHVYNSLGEL